MSQIFPLRDGAQGEWDELLHRLETARPREELPEVQLRNFEASEVGDTPLVRVRNLERELGLRRIFLKLEGANPTGTQKDRIAFAHVRRALHQGLPGIGVATCGNYGVAIALAAAVAGLPCRLFIPSAYHTNRLAEMEQLGAEIVRTQGDYEESVEFSRKWLREAGWSDANPGSENSELQLGTYALIAREIVEVVETVPDSVSVPVSNGTTLAGVSCGFADLLQEGRIRQLPKMVAGSAFRKNPIIRSFLHKLPHCQDLEAGSIHETAVNEPLINWHSADGQVALEALYSTDGLAANASDRKMREFARLLKHKEGILALPASTAGLIAQIESFQKAGVREGLHVAVVTGKGT